MLTHLDECFLAPRYFSHGKSRQTANFALLSPAIVALSRHLRKKVGGNLRCLRWRILAKEIGAVGFLLHTGLLLENTSPPCCQLGEHGAFPNGSSCALSCCFTRLTAELVENFVLTFPVLHVVLPPRPWVPSPTTLCRNVRYRRARDNRLSC